MGLRETLKQRGLPLTTFPFRAVPSDELAAAEAALDEATRDLRRAETTKAVTTALRRRVDDAAEQVQACFQVLTVRAMPPADLEALIAAHPATDAQRDKDPDAVWNRDTFVPALLAACVFDDPAGDEPALTEAEWAIAVTKGASSLGEVAALFNACWQVNDRAPDVRLPKGSTPTRS